MNYLKFLGTGGARIVVAKQVRSSAGIWLSLEGVNLLLDPGPGALVRCWASRPKMPPADLDGIIISHKHLDHAGDVNAMIEGMTEGGFKKKGLLFAPQDALDSEPVVFHYLLDYLNGVEILKGGQSYSVKGLSFSTALRHIHPVETYGLRFQLPEGVLSIITDTRFFPELIPCYRGDILIINVVSLRPFAQDSIDHLSIEDVKEIILNIQPKVAILTHFGMSMLRAKPWEIAEALTRETKTRVIAARDGMQIFLRDL